MSGGNNLVQAIAGCTGFPGSGDKIGVDPLVGALADNGGPTPTRALLAGSPAIDAGGTDCAQTDQRGAPRTTCDIGAYELVRCRGITVNRVGTEGADSLTGTDGSDGVLALGGNDAVTLLAGDDAACLGAGNDRAGGGSGRDRLESARRAGPDLT